MTSVFINYQTHADILQKSQHTLSSTLEECPIINLSINRGPRAGSGLRIGQTYPLRDVQAV